MRNPDFIKLAAEGRKMYFKDMGKNYLKVIVVEEEKELIAVTAHWFAKSKLKSYNN